MKYGRYGDKETGRAETGLVQIYTGCGKGKTTAAAGLAIRAAGRGLPCAAVQFMKTGDSGEIMTMKEKCGIPVFSYGTDRFCIPGAPDPKNIEAAEKAMRKAEELIRQMSSGVLILDEICCAESFGLVETGRILSLIGSKPESLEIVMTGRHAASALIEMADLVTEMKEIKHPMSKGIEARKGIEY